MYQDFFGLRCRAFQDHADPRFFFGEPERTAILSAIENGGDADRVWLVLGRSGVGKTILMRRLAQCLGDSNPAVVLTTPAGGWRNLAREVTKSLGLPLPRMANTRRCLSTILHRLPEHLDGHRAVVVVDCAEDLTTEDIDQVGALRRLRVGDRPLLHVILAGRPESKERLEDWQASSERRRRFDLLEQSLPALTQEQTASYIRHRLQVAGSNKSDLFTGEAVALIHRLSDGNPRRINELCEAALNRACRAKAQTVSPDLMEDVSLCDTKSAIAAAEPNGLSLRSGEVSAVPPQSAVKVVQRKRLPNISENEMAEPDRAGGLPAECPSEVQLAVGTSTSRALAGLRRQEVATRTLEAMTGDAETLIERLERALRRSERVSTAQEAGLEQYMAVEEHLDSLTRNVTPLAQHLDSKAAEASRTLDDIESRALRFFTACEQRLSALEKRVEGAASASAVATHRLNQVDHATERAEQVESRLNSFTERLADTMERAQERVALLMTEMESVEGAYDKLQSMTGQASALVAEAEGTAQVRRAELETTIHRAEDVIRRQEGLELLTERLNAIDHRQQNLRASFEAFTAEVNNAEGRVDSLSKTADEAMARQRGAAGRAEKALAAVEERAAAIESKQSEFMDCAEDAAGRLAQLRAEAGRIGDQIGNQIGEEGRRLGEIKLETQGVQAALNALQQSEVALRTRVAGMDAPFDSLLRRLDAVESRSSALGDDILGYEESLQTAFHRCEREREAIAESVQVAETSRNRLADEVVRCEALTGEVGHAEARLEAMQRTTAAGLVEIGAQCERLHALREETAKFDTLANRLESAGESARQASQQIAERVSEARNSERSVHILVREIESRADQLNTLNGAAHHLLSRLTEVQSAAGQFVEQAADSLQTLEQNIAAMNERAVIDEAAMAESRAALQTLMGESTQARGAIEEVLGRVERTRERLSTSTSDVGGLLDQVKEERGRLDACQRGAAALLIEVGGACERLSALHTRTSHCERLLERMTEGCSQSEDAVRVLTDTVTDARQTAETLRVIVETAGEKLGQLDSHHAAAKHLLGRLTEANVTGHGLVERADEVAERIERDLGELEDQSRRAGEVAEQATMITEQSANNAAALRALNELADRTSQTLAATIARGDKTVVAMSARSESATATVANLQEAGRRAEATFKELAGGLAQAARDLPELSSVQGQAAETINVLRSLHQELDDLVDRAERTSRGAAEAENRLGHSIDEARTLTTAAQRSIDVLGGETEKAAGVSAALFDLREKSVALSSELGASVDRASEQNERLEAHCLRGRRLSARLAELSRRTRTAKQIEDGLSQRSTEAATLQSRLDESVGAARTAAVEAGGKAGELAAARQEAEGLLERISGARMEAETLADRLAQGTDAAANAIERAGSLADRLGEQSNEIEAGGELLRKFMIETEAISKDIAALQQNAADIEGKVEAASKRPEQVIAEAQAQAAQLENVCSAVRKVFAGLSKATLDSDKKKEELKRIHQETAQRLDGLRKETERAAATLQQWVEEAIHAHDRLARTLEQCPSIRETHSAESLSELSRRLRGPNNGGPATTKVDTSGRDRIVAEPVSKPAARIASSGRPLSRTEEIKQIIQDAKQAPVNRMQKARVE